ncbi:tyrosine-type recombinase/integrase [Clostridium sp.]|uniref:tyrosine-type recombinase/integrase n=1 Tax=Clostridium sp. TaxID=1506 RepID=UPI003521BED0
MPKILKSNRDIQFYIEDFMEYCSLKGLSVKTMSSYETTLKLLAKYLQEEYCISTLKEIKGDHISEYLKFTKDRGKYSYVSDDKTVGLNNPAGRKDFGKPVSDVTINNYIRNIKVFFNWLYDQRFIKSNPVDKIGFIKVKRKAKEDITDSEFKALVKALDVTKYHEYRDYVVIQLIMDTGMRLGETLALSYEDIDIDKRAILIPAQISKGKKDRYVFFSSIMAGILRKWLQYKDRYSIADETLFPTRKGTALTVRNFERNFKIYKNRAGISKDIAPHGLRNNFAKRALMSGMDIYTLSRILGHSSVTVTVTEKAYLDLTVTDIRKNYQKFSPLENMQRK